MLLVILSHFFVYYVMFRPEACRSSEWKIYIQLGRAGNKCFQKSNFDKFFSGWHRGLYSNEGPDGETICYCLFIHQPYRSFFTIIHHKDSVKLVNRMRVTNVFWWNLFCWSKHQVTLAISLKISTDLRNKLVLWKTAHFRYVFQVKPSYYIWSACF